MSTPVAVPAGQMVAVNPTGQAAAVTVRNTGAAVIYLTNTTNTNVSAALPLGPGSSQVWDAGRPLYIIGGSIASTALVFDNSGNLFDAASVASALVTSGLALEIAQQITLAGVPSIDSPSIVFGQGRDFNAYASAPFDCSRYQSATIKVASNAGNSGPPRTIDVYLNNPSQPAYQFVVPSSSAYTTFTFPVDGSAVYFTVNLGAVFHAGVELVLSYRNAVTAYRTVSTTYASQLENGGVVVPALGNGTVVNTVDYFSWVGTSPANTGATTYPFRVSRNGRAHFAAQHNGGAGTFSVGVIDSLSGAWLLPTRTLAVGNDLSFDFNIGHRPVSLAFQCAGVAGTALFSITNN